MKSDYCSKSRHIRKTCWKLHERPIRGQEGRRCGTTRAQINFVEVREIPNSPSVGAFSIEKIQNLKHILNQLNSSSTVCTSNMVKSGIVHHISTPDNWIIDSISNRHTIGSFKKFLTYSFCTEWNKVRITDESYIPVLVTCSINCTFTIILFSVLHLSNFSDNLLSISVINRDDTKEMVRLKKLLTQEFEINDLEKLQYFLGIEVVKSNKEIFISQRKYILNLL